MIVRQHDLNFGAQCCTANRIPIFAENALMQSKIDFWMESTKTSINHRKLSYQNMIFIKISCSPTHNNANHY